MTNIKKIWKEYPDKESLSLLREEFPKGTRIRLLKMDDPQAPRPETHGTIDHIDDAGTIHVHWDNGSGLGLVPGEDRFERIGE